MMSDPTLAIQTIPSSQTAAATRASADPRQLDSKELFMGTRELTILHNDQTYLLRLTRQNKLILTK